MPDKRIDKVQLRAVRRVYDGFFPHEQLELAFGGTDQPSVLWERVLHPGGVIVLPYDPRTDQLVLIEQVRAGAIGFTTDATVVEAPAGRREPDEPIEVTARRELLEECGVTAGRLEPMVSFFTSPGVSNEVVSLFVAEADLSRAGGIHGSPHEVEQVVNHLLSLEEAVVWLETGRVTGMSAIVALLWLRLNRDRLRRIWAS